GVSSVAFANQRFNQGARCGGSAMALCLDGQGLMRAEDGTFLSRVDFITRLDSFIAQGLVDISARESFIERYDWCVENGSCSTGLGGLCAGFGNGTGLRNGRCGR
ncbi:MAG: hypothetical protein FWE44_03985, partial [Defluviitaleaceae bacterium]|nr:hypothetical protein [Defluviitaleaceae bacterium]